MPSLRREAPWFLLGGLVVGAVPWALELSQLFDVGATSLAIYLLAVPLISAGVAFRLLPPRTRRRTTVRTIVLLLGALASFWAGMILFFNP